MCVWLVQMLQYERHRQNGPSAISGSAVMLWRYENTFCTQRKQKWWLYSTIRQLWVSANWLCCSVSAAFRIRLLRLFMLWFEQKQRILVARLTQNSIRSLHPADNLQNGAILMQSVYSIVSTHVMHSINCYGFRWSFHSLLRNKFTAEPIECIINSIKLMAH